MKYKSGEKVVKLIKFSILIICLAGCSCKNQNSISSNNQIDIKKKEGWKSTQIKEDTLGIKDLKALSSFSDTLILNRFQNEIKDFEKDDSLNPNRKVDIIFTGSSSIRKWVTLQSDMKGLRVLNRGFGGSTIPEAIYYSDILIFKHKPKQIVFYAGENDIAATKTDSLKVYKSFVYFQKLVKQNLPDAQLFFVSIKLSPSRSEFWNAIKSINIMIEQFCNTTTNCKFIDVNNAMLDEKMQVRKDLYVSDNLHLNQEGYQIWTEIILKTLKKQNK